MNELKMLENELVPVYETDTGEKVVYGSELHAALKVKTAYKDWSIRRLRDCDASENKDYEVLLKNERNSKGGRPQTDHIIKLDTAKEMAMLERNEKGKQVRRYFIAVEKKYKESVSNSGDRLSYQDLKDIIGVISVCPEDRFIYVKGILKSMGFAPEYQTYDQPFNDVELKRYLKAHNVTHDWLKYQIDCTTEELNAWLEGVSRPSDTYQQKIHDALGLPLGFFNNSRRIRQVKRSFCL